MSRSDERTACPRPPGKRIVVQASARRYHAAKFCREGGCTLIAIADREVAIQHKGLH